MKDCYATYLGIGGYPGERQRADRVFMRGRAYKVTGGSMGQTRTLLEIDDIKGRWNSVLFDVDLTKAPIDDPYIRTAPNP